MSADTQVLFRKYPKRWVTKDDYSQTIDNYFVVIPTILDRLQKADFKPSTIRLIHRRNLRRFGLHILIGKSKGLRCDRALIGAIARANRSHALFWVQSPIFLVPSWLPRSVQKLPRFRRQFAGRQA